jgi:very-short-patch-repair endonuclease
MHRPRRLDSQDVTEHEGFPVTTVARTLADMAGDVSPQRLEDMFELIAQATQPEPTRSEFEKLFRRQCRKRGLPLPSFNVLVSELDVDAYWPEQNLVVELDSWEFHRTRAAFERDRARDATLVAAGHRVMRFTWRQLKGQEAWDRLSAALPRERAGA